MERATDIQSQTGTRRGSRKRLVAGVLAIVAVATALIFWRTAKTPGPGRNPLVDTGSPYENTRHGVKYVGNAACVRCHSEICETYAAHPMGRSLTPITSDSAASDASAAGTVLFEAGGLQYSLENRDGH